MCVYAHTGRGKAPGGSSLSLSPSGTLLCVCVSRELLSSCLLLDTLCGDNDTAGAGQKVLMEINEIGCAALSLLPIEFPTLSLSRARAWIRFLSPVSRQGFRRGFSIGFHALACLARARVFSLRISSVSRDAAISPFREFRGHMRV